MRLHYLAVPALLAAFAALAAGPTPARAEPRPVGAPFDGTSLQAYLAGKGETINVAADQAPDAQRWRTTVSGNSAMTLMIEIAADANGNELGVYNAGDPAPVPFAIFPGTATFGQYAMVSFRPGPPPRMIVTLFNEDGSIATPPVTTLNVSIDDFGYYIRRGAEVGYSQDARNPGGAARMLAFRGTNANAGNWWLCFEDADAQDPDADRDFDDAVLFVESINPTPVSRTSWGSLKARFR